MSKMFFIYFLFFLLSSFTTIMASYDIIEIKLQEIKHGALQNEEYDYYNFILPNEVKKNDQLIFKLTKNHELDIINNVVSNPNIYISENQERPTEILHTWSSDKFGDKVITISGNTLNIFRNFHISIFCKKRCNYMLQIFLVNSIPIQEKEMNYFTLNKQTVNKFSFTTRKKFNKLSVFIVRTYLDSFNVYLAKKDASSSNTLKYDSIFYNGYKFDIENNDLENNSDTSYDLIIDNENYKQEINIWLKYDNENIELKENELIYDDLPENKSSCFYYSIDYHNQYKDIIISNSLFNGKGFMYIAGFTSINGEIITKNYKNTQNSYLIEQSKLIHLTKENIKNFKDYNINDKTYLNFCYYAEQKTSLAIKIYLYDNYKQYQKFNYIYPDLRSEYILPKNSFTSYKLQLFRKNNDFKIFLFKKAGNPKLYLYSGTQESNNNLFKYDSFISLKNKEYLIESQESFKENNLLVTKETIPDLIYIFLYAVVECDFTEECVYDLYYFNSKVNNLMEQKIIYTNIISENETDIYYIIINEQGINNIAISLSQNTGTTVGQLLYLVNDEYIKKFNETNQNYDFVNDVIKISNKDLNLEHLYGILCLQVKGLSYASYSIYYYFFNEEENENYLDQDKVCMTLEKGNIIKDIFMDNHKFKVYMYDNSINVNKTNLFVVLIETDYVNSELYIFKDLNDFFMADDKIYGYLWKGGNKDYIYIDKKDKNYLNNKFLYIMIYKKTKIQDTNDYTIFYLGLTDENTPFLLNEGIEFKHHLNKQHRSQKFYYYYIENGQDLQISFSLYNGHIFLKIYIEEYLYNYAILIDDSHLISVKKNVIMEICQYKQKCSINIEVTNDDSFLYYSTFLIAVKSSKNVPIYLKQGLANKRTIFSGEDQHFIVDLKPDKSFGAKISAFFGNDKGEIYARKLLKSELYNITNFPDENNYEYMDSYKSSNKGFYIIEIPYDEISDLNPCKILLTVRGIFPGQYSTKIEYSISVSNTMNEIITEKNYRLFISQGEIAYYHFKVGNNKKRLYISMTNKEKDANMFLNYENYFSSLSNYRWKNLGNFNEYLDISIENSIFVERQMEDIDGDYYLAIQGLDDCFYNLYISTQDVKIITLDKGSPASCTCETDNENCYFRYENINTPIINSVKDQNLIFYTEFTYGSGSIYGKLYPNGNMEEIINNLPTSSNYDYIQNNSNDFLNIKLKRDNLKYTFSSVLVLGIQCKEKSLFDISVVTLDKTSDVTRINNEFSFLKYNQDNVFYLSHSTGKIHKFIYYINKNEDFNFQVKGLYGKVQIHTYTGENIDNYKISENDNRTLSNKNYHHISDFIIDSSKEESKSYYGNVPKKYGKFNYLKIEVKPVEDCLININVNFNDDIRYIPLNKEIIGVFSGHDYYGYFDILKESEEVVITVTSLDKSKKFNVYIKQNTLTPLVNSERISQSKYSKPSSKNYDIKGTTNSLTSAISLKVKNIPLYLRNMLITRVLINIQSDTYSFQHKVKIMVNPVINNINRILPKQHSYYFSVLEKKDKDKSLYILKNLNKEDDLMVIEISICKGNFLYVLVDTPPKNNETYSSLKIRQIESSLYSSNGKNIIIAKNIKVKEYYLIVYGGEYITGFLDKIINENKNDKIKKYSTELLFQYYTTNQKKFNYLVTQDYLTYESNYGNTSLKFKLPELKNRDSFGRENYVDYLNYTLIVSENKTDFDYMGSTCYLTKLKQKKEKNKEYDYLNINYDKQKNTLNVDGFLNEKIYYINILAENEHTGETITYKPIMIITSSIKKKVKIFIIILLFIVFLVLLYFAFRIYRKYRLKKHKINFDISSNSSEKSIGNTKNINMNIIKKQYNNLNEENSNSLNDE